MEKPQKIFTPTIVNWLVALSLGGIIPFALQDYIAIAISSFNSLPSLNETAIQYPLTLSTTIVLATLLTYVIGFAYQARYIALLKTHSSVWALITTILGPITIWFILPLYLGV